MSEKKIYRCETQGTRVDEFLREKIPALVGKTDGLNSKIRRLIVAGEVRVNGKQIRRPAYTLKRGDRVEFALDAGKFFAEKEVNDIAFELTEKDVLFEDEVIIVVNKPAFFPTESTFQESRDNLQGAVIRYLWAKNPSLRNPPYVGIMHRLDRETSGVILFSKSRSVNKALHDMFENHTAHKVYRAVCADPYAADSRFRKNIGKENAFPPPNFQVDNFLARISKKSDRAKWGAVKEADGGLWAHTDFRVALRRKLVKSAEELLSGGGIDALGIDAMPKTGRTHQIRVHLAGLGLPILGDTLYGGTPWTRIMLHALSLIFPHPVTGEMMSVNAPLPPDFI